MIYSDTVKIVKGTLREVTERKQEYLKLITVCLYVCVDKCVLGVFSHANVYVF